MAKKLPQETINQIIELYKTGLSSEKLSKQFNTKAQTITKYLKEAGLEIRGPNKKLSPQDIESMPAMYKDGMSCQKIADKLGVSSAAVFKYLKKQNVELRNADDCHRIYAINENFFDEIDSEEKAYFLGFLYADGCNHKDRNCISLALEQTDEEILQKLSALIYIDNPNEMIKTQDRTHEGKGITKYLNINSKHMCEMLEKHGCMQAKTFKITYPVWLREDLHKHFIRGYFDGDGSVNFENTKTRAHKLKITSTLNMVNSIKNILSHELDMNLSIYECLNSNVYDVYTSGSRQVEKILDCFYNDANIYMKRKHDIYLKIKEKIDETNKLIMAGTQGYKKSILEEHRPDLFEQIKDKNS